MLERRVRQLHQTSAPEGVLQDTEERGLIQTGGNGGKGRENVFLGKRASEQALEGRMSRVLTGGAEVMNCPGRGHSHHIVWQH